MIGSPAVGVILRAELAALQNRLRVANAARLAALIIVLVLGGGLFGTAAFGGGFGLGVFLPAARQPALEGSFVALSVLMLLFGFPSVISSFFSGRDLMQLVVAPVSRFTIFLARSASAVSVNTTVALLLLVFAAGVGVGSRAGVLFYPLAILLVAVQVVTVTAFQLLLMAAILRFVPARIARDVSVALAGVGGAGVYLAWNLTIRQTFVPRQRPDFTRLINVLRGFDWVPTGWPGHALGSVLAGEAPAALAWTGLTILLAVVLLGAGALLYERTLLSGLGLLGGPSTVWRRARKPERSRGGIASPLLAIAWKDLLSYRRDLKRISRVLPALLFLGAYAFVLARPSDVIDPFWNDVLVATLTTTVASTAIAVPAVPSERRAYQLLRMAPVTELQVIAAKILTILPVTGFTVLVTLVVAIAGHVGLPGTVGLGALAVWMGLGATAIGVSSGAIDPHFESVDDRRAVGLAGTLAAMLGLLGFALCSVAAFALFRLGLDSLRGVVEFGFLPATPAVGLAAWALGLALAAGATAVVAGLVVAARGRLRAFQGAISVV